MEHRNSQCVVRQFGIRERRRRGRASRDMANSTDPLALSVHGTNPQNLIEKILRTKIYANLFWKEHCFGLTAETLVDKGMQLTHVGGTYGGNRKPTKFMCLVLKMLQIQPEKEIILEFIKQEDYKYVRVLGAFYLRLTGQPADVYKYLEPLCMDFRKVRHRAALGWELRNIDEFIDELLVGDYSCDIALPRLPKRWHLESQGLLKPRDRADDDLFLDDDEPSAIKHDEPPGAAAMTEVDGSKGNDRDDRSGPPREKREEANHPSRDDTRPRGRAHERGASRDRRDSRELRRSDSRERPSSHDRRDSGRRPRSSSYDRRDSGRRPRAPSPSPSPRASYRHGRGRDDSDDSRSRSRERRRSPPARHRRRSRSDSRSPPSPRRRDADRKAKGARLFKKQPAIAKPETKPGKTADAADTGGSEALTVDATNALRAKLGLKPLK